MSTLKRCASVYQGLDKKMKHDSLLPTPAPPSSPSSTTTDEEELKDSPSHFELEPATPIACSTPIKQEPMVYSNNYDVMQFTEGVKRYNGYICRFLKKPLKLQLFSAAMSITCNISVAVFSMPRLIRARLIKKMDELLEAGGPCDRKKNPFTRSPVFLTLGPHVQLFRQPALAAAAEPFNQDELKRGTYFHGRLSLEVLGVKFHNASNELSLMLRVNELYMMADHVTRDDENEENMGVCSLEEPLEGEDGSDDDGIDY